MGSGCIADAGIRRRHIRAIPIPSSRTGRSIPMIGATSFAKCGTTGIAVTTARSTSTCSRPRSRSGWAWTRSYASITSSAAKVWRWNTMAACIPAITMYIPNTSWATSRKNMSSRMVFSERAEEVRLRQARRPAATVPRLQILVCLQRRVSQEPPDSHPRRASQD